MQSYKTKETNGNIAIVGTQIKLPKLGLVRFAKSREVEGRILNATVRRNPSGKYFVSILAETEVQSIEKTGSSVGVDVGLKNFAILSTGEVFSNPKWFRKLEEKLAQAQRVLSIETWGRFSCSTLEHENRPFVFPKTTIKSKTLLFTREDPKSKEMKESP